MSDKKILQKMGKCILKRMYTVFAGSVPFFLVELLPSQPIVYLFLFLFFFGIASLTFISSMRDDHMIKRLLKKRENNRTRAQHVPQKPSLLYLPRRTEHKLAVNRFKGAS